MTAAAVHWACPTCTTVGVTDRSAEQHVRATGHATHLDPGDDQRESTPGQWCGNTYPGPRRPNGDDRLMNKIDERADTTPQPPICPVCNQHATASSVRRDDRTATGDYRCGMGHIWQTKWFEAA